jgi:predicted PurR-regulated permease PerM
MTRRFRIGILVVLVVFLSYLAYLVLVPFFAPLTWAAVFAIVFYPVYLVILRHLKRPSLAALSSVALVLIIILGPLSYLSYFLAGELQNLSNAGLTMEGMRSVYRDSFISGVAKSVLSVFHLNEQQAMAYVANGVSNFSRQLLHWVPAGLGSVASGFLHFLVMAFILFFLFKDGSVYALKILEYLPFSERNKEHLSRQDGFSVHLSFGARRHPGIRPHRHYRRASHYGRLYIFHCYRERRRGRGVNGSPTVNLRERNRPHIPPDCIE